jgi:hypothetical protein
VPAGALAIVAAAEILLTGGQGWETRPHRRQVDRSVRVAGGRRDGLRSSEMPPSPAWALLPVPVLGL